MATMARQLKRHDVMEKAQRWYGKALKNLAVALNQTEVAKHDGTLLAVALLGLYEVSLKYKHSQFLETGLLIVCNWFLLTIG
jgi:hypothetical protein